MFVTPWVERGYSYCILPCWFKTSICFFFFFFYTDEVIDETYGVAVQFDEEEEEVILNIKSDKNLC